MAVSATRVRRANAAPVRADGTYVLYWMIAARRTRFNQALEHAVALGRQLGRPVLIFEPLRVGYRWASDRHHAFVLDGMADNAAAAAAAGVTYLPWVERAAGEGQGLLAALAARAAVVVTDEYPTFFLPSMVAAAAARLPVALDVVDGNGLLPLRAADRAFTVAHAFRRHLHKVLRAHVHDLPEPDPLAGYDLGAAAVPAEVLARWPAADVVATRGALASLPIDHTVGAVAGVRGGARAAGEVLEAFLDRRLARYPDDRNHPDDGAASGLSPWLHFGHLSAVEVVRRVWAREGWAADRLAPKPTGQREGWWGLSPEGEAFLDELVTWREVGYGFCYHRPDHTAFTSLPDWALTTLAEHAHDPREALYDLDTLAQARTSDPLWNAAQRELVRTGRMHNYLRMLWGKRVLAWTRTPEEALGVLIELNNRYALDGRDPNSYSGIFWVFGRFDRAWGPERPIYGKVRYMTSDSTRRKLRLSSYLARYGP